MRMLNDINPILEVEEVTWLDGTQCWKHGTESNPDNFFVSVQYVGREEDDILGEYILDGTTETYQKAVENFNSICIQAAEKGFFRLSDFKGFSLV